MVKTLAHLKKIGFYEEIHTKNPPLLNSAAGPPAGPPGGPPHDPSKGLQELVLRMLRVRFGSVLMAQHKQQILQLSVEQTDDLLEAFLDFQTSADLLTWMVAHEMLSA